MGAALRIRVTCRLFYRFTARHDPEMRTQSNTLTAEQPVQIPARALRLAGIEAVAEEPEAAARAVFNAEIIARQTVRRATRAARLRSGPS